MLFHTRNLLGILIKDWLRYHRALNGRNGNYLQLCNRNEQLEAAPDGIGYLCNWKWTSDLHAPKVLSSLGLRLMVKALTEHPIDRAAAPSIPAPKPDVSFVIGHRGLARLPNLLVTLESIAAQVAANIECIVVEQSATPEVKDKLPGWIRYIHTPLPHGDMLYCRAWAFNVGAHAAQGETLVLHDNDMMVPADYAKEVLTRRKDGYEAMNLKRFIFYLSERHSAAVIAEGKHLAGRPPQVVVQNLEAGGSLAIAREAYFRIGGFDESFIGWGGEDNEFWERVQTLRVWPYGYLPIVHLWHANQTGKFESERETTKLLETRSAIPPQERIAELTSRAFGSIHGPAVATSN